MAYRTYKYRLFFRILLVLACIALFIVAFHYKHTHAMVATALISLFAFINLYHYIDKRFTEISDFMESIKYRDFSRWFNEKAGAKDIRELHKSFNSVIRTIKVMNNEKEVQHIYLQRILEMVDTGIIAYNTRSGEVLLVNDAFKEILDVPSFKKVSFIEKRKQEFHAEVFEKNHPQTTALSLYIGKEKVNVLVSDSLFKIDEEPYKIIAIQNIDETIDHTESEAWKKLLSVMTHEIMNSIAPIASLAETLQNHIRASIEHPHEHPLEMEDMEVGIESIKKRSEGLMMFAKTYRSLHKITQLNLSTVLLANMFNNIKNLISPSLNDKAIALSFELEDSSLKVAIDLYLIEQVLINLILNAIDATESLADARVKVSAFKNPKGNVVIQVADNGTGIPEEIIDKVFVPFFTTKKNGSGVGLSLGKQIMLLHKGKIQINSTMGQGTVIRLLFP